MVTVVGKVVALDVELEVPRQGRGMVVGCAARMRREKKPCGCAISSLGVGLNDRN